MRIAYIVGTKNCGSTLLDTLIGQAEGVRSLGEVGGFYRYVSEATCDCGQRAAGCEPCDAVLTALRQSRRLTDLQRLLPLVKKEKCIHWSLLPTRNRRRYAELSDRIFQAIVEKTGSEMLVDSTKNIGRAAALAHASACDVRFIHLIRDGRGFLASRRGRSPIEGRKYGAVSAQFEWLSKNLAIWMLLRPKLKPGTYILCRYEDLIVDPDRELARIGAFLGIDLQGVADRARGQGVARSHVYEPRRHQDYALVRLKSSKLEGQKLHGGANFVYWVGGGFLSLLWRYDYRQSYIDHVKSQT